MAFTGLRVQILNHKEISLKNILKVYSLVKKAFVNFKYPFFELINPPRLIEYNESRFISSYKGRPLSRLSDNLKGHPKQQLEDSQQVVTPTS